ncbi:MAG: type III-B CRISPR module RAMP protein Cmr6 [Desulfurococcales archaeon]|nr:type III-B CRISPR module RAMP protein Cmr6 [Desulfurococcales archaeon]
MDSCESYLLCIIKKYEERVLNYYKMGKLPTKVKTELLEDIASKQLDDRSLCAAIDRVKRIYYGEVLKALESLGYCVVDATARLNSRLLVGASSGALAAVFDIGLSWDQVLGLPFIPGSSLKGLLRSWSIRYCLERYGDSQARRGCIEDFLALTGLGGEALTREELREYGSLLGVEKVELKEASAGLLLVFDAYPVRGGAGSGGCGLLEPDVLTPHYYRGGRPVQDEFEATPVPVVHLSVAKGSEFRFTLAVPRLEKGLRSRLAGLLGLNREAGEALIAFKLFSEAILEGVGARTGKGYGVFEITSLRASHSACQEAQPRARRPGSLKWILG